MIDLLTLALTHGLIVLAFWRLLFRDELDSEEPVRPSKPWLRQKPAARDEGAGDA